MKRPSFTLEVAAAAVAIFAYAAPLTADDGIDLVTLPERASVQLTIYNSADLTLVRDVRRLTLRRGLNRLSFEWAGTLIDPTSLQLRAVSDPTAVELVEVAYPPGLNTKAVWTVQSEVEGEVPVEITFFTSGVSWRAFYMGTLSPDERTMRLQNYVRVQNQSGEEYADAVTRLIVGKIHLLDEIAALARRNEPYGRPGVPGAPQSGVDGKRRVMMQRASRSLDLASAKAKQIVKEGLSEYFLYTIEGTETIPNGWAKRLPSFAVDEVPVVNLYRYEEERFGQSVVRFILFANDDAHRLGETPLPGGNVSMYRAVDDAGHLSYVGATTIQYIPVEQKAELGFGAAQDVLVTPKQISIEYENFEFHSNGNIRGFDEEQTWEVTVKNRRAIPIRVEVTRNFRHQSHTLTNTDVAAGEFEKIDLDTARYTFEIAPGAERRFGYTVRYREGSRAN